MPRSPSVRAAGVPACRDRTRSRTTLRLAGVFTALWGEDSSAASRDASRVSRTWESDHTRRGLRMFPALVACVGWLGRWCASHWGCGLRYLLHDCPRSVTEDDHHLR